MPYVKNLEKDTEENENFRKVLNTTDKSQLVVMSLLSHEDIGEEVHENVDQFIRLEKGEGKAILDGVETEINNGWAVVIPAGTRHNIVNLGTGTMKLYTLYTPPNHPEGTIHKTKAEAEEAEASEHHAN